MGGVAEHVGAPGVDQVDRPPGRTAQSALRQPVAPFGGVVGGADHGDRAGVEEARRSTSLVQAAMLRALRAWATSSGCSRRVGHDLRGHPAHPGADLGERRVGLGGDVAEQRPPPPRVGRRVGHHVGDDDDSPPGEDAFGLRSHRDVGRLRPPASRARGPPRPRRWSRRRRRGSAGRSRRRAIPRGAFAAEDAAEGVTGAEQRLHVQAVGVGQEAVGVGDAQPRGRPPAPGIARSRRPWSRSPG